MLLLYFHQFHVQNFTSSFDLTKFTQSFLFTIVGKLDLLIVNFYKIFEYFLQRLRELNVILML